LDSLPPFPWRPKQCLESERTVGHIKKLRLILASHRKMKKSLNILLLSSDLAPIQIRNHAYSLIGIYSEKTGYKHKWHKYFTHPQRTDINGLVFKCFTLHKRSRVSSGSTVSDYGLYDRAIGIRSPAGAKDFSSILCVQTGSG
jgi:hypothetical protein